MKTRPLRFEELSENRLLFTNDAGDYFFSNQEFLKRFSDGSLTDDDVNFLKMNGHHPIENDELEEISFQKRWFDRINQASEINYVILVPTLRCNLSCNYCQVSRAPENSKAFDWDTTTVERVKNFLSELTTRNIKIEFQGGEPLLRIDLLEEIRNFCRNHFQEPQFVVCTNLQRVSGREWQFLESDDTYISTSLDPTPERHINQRTKSPELQREFECNLARAIETLGAEKVSALPTLNPNDLPDPESMINEYTRMGFKSIYLRRINFQGFARKSYKNSFADEAWFDYFDRFVNAVVKWNDDKDDNIEEFYLANIIRRIVKGGYNGNVDLRNPNWVASDYIVIDYDGRLYPSDESRMITRIGQMDLSIGDVATGINVDKVEHLNNSVINFDDPDCCDCAFQPYCGLDIVDDISRYSRVDLPRGETYHCRWHKVLFHKAFGMIYSDDHRVQKTVAGWLMTPKTSPHLRPMHK